MSFPEGLDYGWVALDGRGNVGFFTNAGAGPIPAGVVAERPSTDEAEQLVLDLPERGEGRQLVETPAVPDAFVRFAKRGVFVYDWQDVHPVRPKRTGCYELVARPSVEVTISELPLELARLARLTNLHTMMFGETTMIDLGHYVTVVESDTWSTPGGSPGPGVSFGH
jgi:hypothetical protein